MNRKLPETVVVGRIVRPHGLRGEVVVEVLSDVPDRFARHRELLLVGPGAERRNVRVLGVRGHESRLIVQFEDCADRDAAERLRGAVVEVERAQVPCLPRGDYYQFEILECRCRDRTLGDLGEVAEIVEDGGGVLLRVVQGKEELLVPFVEAFITHIDVCRGVIDLDLPRGLIESCASKS